MNYVCLYDGKQRLFFVFQAFVQDPLRDVDHHRDGFFASRSPPRSLLPQGRKEKPFRLAEARVVDDFRQHVVDVHVHVATSIQYDCFPTHQNIISASTGEYGFPHYGRMIFLLGT